MAPVNQEEEEESKVAPVEREERTDLDRQSEAELQLVCGTISPNYSSFS